MRIELDKPLTKTKMRQILKMIGNEGKEIKVIMGTEIFDIDTVVSKNDTIYLCTDSKSTSDFYANKVKNEQSDDENSVDDYYKNTTYVLKVSDDWVKKYKDFLEEHGYEVGDISPYDSGVT